MWSKQDLFVRNPAYCVCRDSILSSMRFNITIQNTFISKHSDMKRQLWQLLKSPIFQTSTSTTFNQSSGKISSFHTCVYKEYKISAENSTSAFSISATILSTIRGFIFLYTLNSISQFFNRWRWWISVVVINHMYDGLASDSLANYFTVCMVYDKEASSQSLLRIMRCFTSLSMFLYIFVYSFVSRRVRA